MVRIPTSMIPVLGSVADCFKASRCNLEENAGLVQAVWMLIAYRRHAVSMIIAWRTGGLFKALFCKTGLPSAVGEDLTTHAN